MLSCQTWYDLARAIPQTNWITLTITVCGVVLLHCGRQYVNPHVQARWRVPVPFELVLVIVGVIISIAFKLEENFHVHVVEHIPRGLVDFRKKRQFQIPLPEDSALSSFTWCDLGSTANCNHLCGALSLDGKTLCKEA